MIWRKQVALTFDDGHKYAMEILEGLQKHHVKATFFLCGWCMERDPEICRSIYKGKHEIGNHSYSHAYMDKLSDPEVLEEIGKVQQISEKLTGRESKWFRFPYGKKDEHLCQLVHQKGLRSVGWSIDSRDWEGISAEQIFNNVMEQREIRSGDIILMHTSGAHTAEALDLIIPALKRQGCQMVRISDLAWRPLLYLELRRRKLVI